MSRSIDHGLNEAAKAVGLVVAVATGLALVGFIVLGGFVHLDVSKEEAVTLDFQDIESALKVYRTRTGHLPTDAEGFSPLIAVGILERLPVDPWGREYEYRFDGSRAEIRSLGRDGAPGGTGADADLSRTLPLLDDEGERSPR